MSFNSISPQRRWEDEKISPQWVMPHIIWQLTLMMVTIFAWPWKLLTTYEFPKKIFLWISISYWASKKNLWPENWTPRWLNTGPPVSPTGMDAPARVMQLDWSRFLCTTKPDWGPRSKRDWPHTWGPPKAHPNPPTFGLKAMWGVNALPSLRGRSRVFGGRT